MYGQAESVFLMDLSLEEPAGAVFINPARLGFGTLFAVHSSGGGGGGGMISVHPKIKN